MKLFAVFDAGDHCCYKDGKGYYRGNVGREVKETREDVAAGGERCGLDSETRTADDVRRGDRTEGCR